MAHSSVVIDANVLISVCSKETSLATAEKAIADYAAKKWKFYTPGVIVSEFLFVLCRKLSDGLITADAYDDAVELFKDYMSEISAPPDGDKSLIQRAREIQSGYSCLHSADCLYIALAEDLAKIGKAELLTFDKRVVNVAARHAPTVKVKLLPI